MLKLLDPVILNRDLPRERLKAGDRGVVVEVYSDAVEVEFQTPSGTIVSLRLDPVTLERAQ